MIEVLSPGNKVSGPMGWRVSEWNAARDHEIAQPLGRDRLTSQGHLPRAGKRFGRHEYFVHVSPVDRVRGLVWPILFHNDCQ